MTEQDGIYHLKTCAKKAAMTLASLLDREDFPAVQRAAATDILNQIAKFKELEEQEERLANLEKLIRNTRFTRNTCFVENTFIYCN
jgi:hypothetical protein